MNQFLDLLEGTFANKRQAQGHPTRYAHIRVSHRKISENRLYGEQAYNYQLNRPYRQFVIEVVAEKGQFRLKNYEIRTPLLSCQPIPVLIMVAPTFSMALPKVTISSQELPFSTKSNIESL